MSARPPTALVRFCLVLLLAVAGLVCPCPAVEAAHATTPHENFAHSCCDEATGQVPADHRTEHSHGDGCKHCSDVPQLKPTAGEVMEAAFVATGDALSLPARLRSTAVTTIDPGRFRAASSVHPPFVLRQFRTVVLLI